MVGHDDEFVQQIGAAISIVEKSFHQGYGYFWDLEASAALPAFCGDKVGGAWGGSMRWCRHPELSSGAEAPIYPVQCRG